MINKSHNASFIKRWVSHFVFAIKIALYYSLIQFHTELAPENLTALQIRAQTEYEKGAFERSLVLAHRGSRIRRLPPDFAECARHAEETVKYPRSEFTLEFGRQFI